MPAVIGHRYDADIEIVRHEQALRQRPAVVTNGREHRLRVEQSGGLLQGDDRTALELRHQTRGEQPILVAGGPYQMPDLREHFGVALREKQRDGTWLGEEQVLVSVAGPVIQNFDLARATGPRLDLQCDSTYRFEGRRQVSALHSRTCNRGKRIERSWSVRLAHINFGHSDYYPRALNRVAYRRLGPYRFSKSA